MDFNLDFNAPMFVDFGNEDLDANPESYFGKESKIWSCFVEVFVFFPWSYLEVDHEAEEPLGVPQGLIDDEASVVETDDAETDGRSDNVDG